MRNWNIFAPAYRLDRSACLKPTYEELKHCLKIFKQFVFRVWSLPMRNWNNSGIHHLVFYIMFEAYLWGIETRRGGYLSPRPSPVWSLPMRNWNYVQPPYYNMGVERLKPTYEELKRCWHWLVRCSKGCLKPTYEELKLAIKDRLQMVMFGLKPTYEELKQCHRRTHIRCRYWFEAYLWGIETCSPFHRYYRKRVWSLPMRNWNSSYSANSFVTGSGLKPTYEELKLILKANYLLQMVKFEAYLWGIETA